MYQRGVRGATQARNNLSESILEATAKLLTTMTTRNEINTEDLAAVMFSATPDLNADFPPTAARSKLGWHDVPLMSAQEVERPGALTRCIRVLMLWNTTKTQQEINHVYIDGAQILRPDLKK